VCVPSSWSQRRMSSVKREICSRGHARSTVSLALTAVLPGKPGTCPCPCPAPSAAAIAVAADRAGPASAGSVAEARATSAA
jgi:hypothetical protein